MAQRGAREAAVGAGFLVGGIAFLCLAAKTQEQAWAQQLARAMRAPVVAAAAPCASERVSSNREKAVASAAASGITASSAAPSASASAPAPQSSGGGAGGNDALDPREGDVLRFEPNDIILPKEEIVRLRTVAARLLHNLQEKVVIEGFADGPEGDHTSLARRRALLVKQTLNEIGVAKDRMVIATPPVESAPAWAGTARIRPAPRAPGDVR